MVRELKELNIESFYHLHNKEEQGGENKPTFFLYRNRKRPYHLDYIFGSEMFLSHLKTVTIGQPNKWLKLSDHLPVICELE